MVRYLITFLFCLPLFAFANGYPVDEFESGIYIGAAVKSEIVAIDDEVLTIDLTALPKTQKATITALYNLKVDTATSNLKIAFISHQLLNKEVTISLNGNTIDPNHIAIDTLPSELTIPTTTPTFNLRDTLDYNILLDSTGYVLFEIDNLMEGKHQLKVEYNIQPAVLHKDFGSLTRIHQVSYALAPAKFWKSFNGLEVNVLVPDKWEVKSNLELIHKDYLLNGKFETIPADNLLLSVRRDGKKIYNLLNSLRKLIYFLIAVLLIFTLYKLVQKNYSKPKFKLKMGAFILIVALLMPLVWFYNELAVIPLANHFLEGEVNRNLLDFNGYGLIMYAIFIAPIIILLTIVVQTIIATIFFAILKSNENPRMI